MACRYKASDIDSMRAECSAHEYDALCESGDLSSFLYDGCVGWKNMPEQEVIDYWEENIWVGKDDGTPAQIGGATPRPDDEEWIVHSWTDNPEAVQDAIREGREDERTGYQRRDGN